MLNKEFSVKIAKELAIDLELKNPKEIISVLDSQEDKICKNIFFEFSMHTVTEIFPLIPNNLFQKIFTQADTHKAARVLSKFNRNVVDKKLELLPEPTSIEIKELLIFKENTASFLMETTILSGYKNDTVETVLIKLRQLGDRRIITVYIVDDEQRLVGRVPVNYIAIAHPSQKLDELMYVAYSVKEMATREEILYAIEAHSLLQIPVVDAQNRLLGIIRNDIVLTASKEEASGDLQTMFGAGKEEHALSHASFAIRKRLPWLQINLLTAFLASMVVGFFEETIAQITILAIFLPVVAGQSGNTGSQALAVTIRGLALKEIRIGQWLLVAKKELMVGFVNGVAVAITTGIVVFFWANSAGIALVIGVSMIFSMVIAGFSGAVIPIGLKAIGQDPATSSSIILTTVTDICGFLSFLGLASALSSVLGIV